MKGFPVGTQSYEMFPWREPRTVKGFPRWEDRLRQVGLVGAQDYQMFPWREPRGYERFTLVRA